MANNLRGLLGGIALLLGGLLSQPVVASPDSLLSSSSIWWELGLKRLEPLTDAEVGNYSQTLEYEEELPEPIIEDGVRIVPYIEA